MPVAICFIVFACLFTLAWLSTYRPGKKDPQRLLADLRSDAQAGIEPYGDDGESYPTRPGMLRHVLLMCRNAATLLDIARTQVDQAAPEEIEELRQLWGKCILLRFCLIGCCFESGVRMLFEGIPAFYPRLAATLYGEICSTVYGLLEIGRPDLLDHARNVL